MNVRMASFLLVGIVSFSMGIASAASAQRYGLTGTQRFSFNVELWSRETDDNGKEHFMKVGRLHVRAVRPQYLREDVLESANFRQNLPNGSVRFREYLTFDYLISDGKTRYWITNMSKQTGNLQAPLFVQKEKADSTITGTGSETRGGMSSPNIIFAENPLRQFHFRSEGITNMEGKPVHVYTMVMGEADKDSQNRYRLLLDKDSLPVALEIYYKLNATWQLDSREIFSSWERNKPIPLSCFDQSRLK